MDIVERMRALARYQAWANTAATSGRSKWTPEEFQAWKDADEVARLQSENERLRAALKQIAVDCDKVLGDEKSPGAEAGA